MAKSEYDTFEKIIDVTFDDKAYIRTALTHRSFNNKRGVRVEHNERLEFLGDAVLELLVTDYLYTKFANEKEGYLTSMRAATVKTSSLAEEAERLGFGDFIIMSKGEDMTGGRKRPYILANTFEAVIGAIYLDQGLESSRVFLSRELFYKIGEISEKRLDLDAKSKLQEKSQDEVNDTPYYIMIGSNGPDHDKIFKMRAIISKVRCGIGSGRNKQEAEQVAAAKTLEKWGEYKKKIRGISNK